MASDPPRSATADEPPPPEPRSPGGADTGATLTPPLAARRSRRTGRGAREPRAGPVPGRLDLGDAIHDGWLAFCRAPRVFAGYALLVNVLIVLQQPLLARVGSVARPSTDPRDWALYGLGLALMATVFLWGSLGLGRGSLLALQGVRPTIAQLLQWDGKAWLRLLRAWLRLAAMVGLPVAAALVLCGLPLLMLQVEPALQRLLGQDLTRLLALALAALLLLSLALTLLGLLYLAVNQAFMLQIVLVEKRAGAAAVRRGRELVDPQWPLVLLLVIVMTLLNGLGLLACAVGSLVAWPALICISTAAYQQLRDNEERLNAQAALTDGSTATISGGAMATATEPQAADPDRAGS